MELVVLENSWICDLFTPPGHMSSGMLFQSTILKLS